ncbi:MAG: hypothetical protein FD147_230 [Chloroflexi bacterium]|nr:MAG: hypothetical protein FD147_230 [Chloroflexota bacterium]
MEEKIERIKFSEVSAALKDLDHPFPVRLLRGFSDLISKEIKELVSIWVELPVQRKQNLLEDLEEITEKDTLVNFDELAKMVIADGDPMVRVLALRLLWECEDAKIVPGIIEIMLTDPDEAVRATSAALLGRFVYLGELDSIPDAVKISVVKNLLEVVTGEDLIQVRLRALESLGYSSHPKVPAVIKSAYDSNENQWVSSALCAMGRSADDQWTDLVLNKLDSSDSEIVFEAVRAAGDLELTSAVDQLLLLIEEDDCESELRLATIWSLSQIGGDEVKVKLDELLQGAENDEELNWIEKAVENLELSGNSEGLDLLDFERDEDNELQDFEGDEGELDDEDEFESLNILNGDDEEDE